MNSHTRRRKIESYGAAYDRLVEALRHFPQEMWRFTTEDDPWSIHDILVHITDSEVNGFARCRRCIAEPGESVMAYDESTWAGALDYATQDATVALELFKWLRLSTYHLIDALPDTVWANTIEHPENGTMTLDDWLDSYEQHVPDHIQQMQRIHEAWRVQQDDEETGDDISALGGDQSGG